MDFTGKCIHVNELKTIRLDAHVASTVLREYLYLFKNFCNISDCRGSHD